MYPKTKKGMISSWIFRYLYDHEYVWPRSITVGYHYDDESEFLEAFEQEFPGRDSRNSDAVKRRLAKYLNQLYRNGWLEKGQRYNDAHYMGEMRSGMYPIFSLPTTSAKKIKSGFWTPESMGGRYWG